MLEIKDVSKSYISGSGEKRAILDQLNFSINEGEKVAIVGPSGSGKTTLLNLIGTLDRPDSGEILIGNEPVFSKSEKELAVFRNKSIGFIFQLHHLLPQLNLLDNVLLPVLANQKRVGQDVLNHAKQLLAKLGLEKVKYQKPAHLSGGECQRAAVARALINRPKLVLADEPTGALDHYSSGQLTDMIIKLNEGEGTTLLVVTHSIELAQKMDKIYQLTDGKLILQ